MIWSALLLGLVGSLHCVGMCGPLILAASTGQRPAWQSALYYHSGRALSYAVLGALAGAFGHVLFRGAWQLAIGWISGIALVVWGLWLAWNRGSLLHLPPFWRKMAGSLLRAQSGFGLLSLGMVNGLIPCGLLWAALAGAALQGSWLNGLGFMVLFSMGTWPVLFGLSAVRDVLQPVLKHRQRWVALWVICTGIWIMYRSYQTDLEKKSAIPECHSQVGRSKANFCFCRV